MKDVYVLCEFEGRSLFGSGGKGYKKIHGVVSGSRPAPMDKSAASLMWI
jgi:hypothetical protein